MTNTNATPKKWYESKGVWGGIVALLAAIAGAFGYAIDADTQASVVELIMITSGGIGGLLAIYGRIKAERRVTK